MTGTGEEVQDMAKFELGVSEKEVNDTYTNIGYILRVIIEAKMNENFFDFLFELKPITSIDNYMKRFNNELDLALRHNEHLSLIIRFLVQDAGELKNESEAALSSILKVDEFIKFLAKQESHYEEFMVKTSEIIVHKEQENRIDSESPMGQMMSTKPSATIGSATQETKPSGHVETKVTLTINNNPQTLSVDKALQEVKKTREEFERHLKATTGLRMCMEGLVAINQHNNFKIRQWRDNAKRDK